MSNEKAVVEVLGLVEKARKHGPWPAEMFNRLFDMLYDENIIGLPEIRDRSQLYINEKGKPFFDCNELGSAIVAEIEQFEQISTW